MEDNDKLRRHKHTGTDGTEKLDRSFFVNISIPVANDAVYYTTFWQAPFVCKVLSILESHTVLGTDAGDVKVTVEKLTGTTALGSGIELATAQSLKTTINTVVDLNLTSSRSELFLSETDRLALKLTGTPTAVAGLVITLKLDKI